MSAVFREVDVSVVAGGAVVLKRICVVELPSFKMKMYKLKTKLPAKLIIYKINIRLVNSKKNKLSRLIFQQKIIKLMKNL